jgi:hypothetical protein
VKFVSRAAWGARPPEYRTGFTPSFGTTIHYEGPRMGSFPHASCAAKVRGIQAFHMDARGWSDGAYTAIVCPHGYVFEMRWIGARTGANGTNQGNDTAYAVCALIGQGDPMPAVMVEAIAELTAFLRDKGRAGSRVNGHRDWKPTACPGDPLYAEVKAGRFTGTPPKPPHPPPPPTEEQELMAVKDEITKAIKDSQDTTIAYLAKVIADSEARLNDRIDRAGADGVALRDAKSKRVYVVTADGKTWVQPDELDLLVLLGRVQRWPGFHDTKKIPVVDPKYLDGLSDAAELKDELEEIKTALEAIAAAPKPDSEPETK